MTAAEIQLPESLQIGAADGHEGSLENVLLCTDLAAVAVDVQQVPVDVTKRFLRRHRRCGESLPLSSVLRLVYICGQGQWGGEFLAKLTNNRLGRKGTALTYRWYTSPKVNLTSL